MQRYYEDGTFSEIAYTGEEFCEPAVGADSRRIAARIDSLTWKFRIQNWITPFGRQHVSQWFIRGVTIGSAI